MSVRILCFCLLAGGLLLSAMAAEKPDAAHQEVYRMFQAQDLPSSIEKMVRFSVESQIAANPALEPYRDALVKYCLSCVGYECMKAELAELYLRHFTREEIRSITAFYQSPAGKKMVKASAPILAETTVLIMKKISEKAPDLMKLMRK